MKRTNFRLTRCELLIVFDALLTPPLLANVYILLFIIYSLWIVHEIH